jgi:phenylacetate-CoA ligase
MLVSEENKIVIWRSSGGTSTGTPFWWALHKKMLTVHVLSRFLYELELRNKPITKAAFAHNFYTEYNYPHTSNRSEFKWFSRGDITLQSSSASLFEQIENLLYQIKISSFSVLRTTPSELLVLAKELRRNNKSHQIDIISLTGQMLDEETRHLAIQILGGEILMHYGAQEIGPIGFECTSHHGTYHLFEERVIVEILDEDGHTVSQGNSGNITVTVLDNLIMPLIRYQLGDTGILHVSCSCGKKSLRLEITQRITDIIYFKDGTSSPAIRMLRIFNESPFLEKIRRFQIEHISVGKVVVRLEIREPLESVHKQLVVTKIHQKYSNHLEVELEETNEIATRGKYKVFIPLKNTTN